MTSFEFSIFLFNTLLTIIFIFFIILYIYCAVVFRLIPEIKSFFFLKRFKIIIDYNIFKNINNVNLYNAKIISLRTGKVYNIIIYDKYFNFSTVNNDFKNFLYENEIEYFEKYFEKCINNKLKNDAKKELYEKNKNILKQRKENGI